MSDKIKILFLAANPILSEPLRIDAEVREIESERQRALDRDRFELISIGAVRASDIQPALLRHRPQIVHFSGHGSERDGILVENATACAEPISGEALAALFKELTCIRVVVLNACWSRTAAEAFSDLVDYTVAMDRLISDRAATVFSVAFYRALIYGESVPVAFALGLAELKLFGIPEADIPLLFRRQGLIADDPIAKPLGDPPARKQRIEEGGDPKLEPRMQFEQFRMHDVNFDEVEKIVTPDPKLDPHIQIEKSRLRDLFFGPTRIVYEKSGADDSRKRLFLQLSGGFGILVIAATLSYRFLNHPVNGAPITVQADSEGTSYDAITVEQRPHKIQYALDVEHDLATALRLLNGFKAGEEATKERETERIFNYCIANEKLKEAEVVYSLMSQAEKDTNHEALGRLQNSIQLKQLNK